MMGGRIAEELTKMQEDVKKIREGLDKERAEFRVTLNTERKVFQEQQKQEREFHQSTEKFANKFALFGGIITLVIAAPTMGPALALVGGNGTAAAAVLSTSFAVGQFCKLIGSALYPHVPHYFLKTFCCEKELASYSSDSSNLTVVIAERENKDLDVIKTPSDARSPETTLSLPAVPAQRKPQTNENSPLSNSTTVAPVVAFAAAKHRDSSSMGSTSTQPEKGGKTPSKKATPAKKTRT